MLESTSKKDSLKKKSSTGAGAGARAAPRTTSSCQCQANRYAAKEASRWMSSPCCVGQEKILRIGKCPKGVSRTVVQAVPFGRGDGVIDTYSDSDRAGSLSTRGSTSGG